jgi:hypothetical protein
MIQPFKKPVIIVGIIIIIRIIIIHRYLYGNHNMMGISKTRFVSCGH